jgi:hypothetical protein
MVVVCNDEDHPTDLFFYPSPAARSIFFVLTAGAGKDNLLDIDAVSVLIWLIGV